MSEFKFFKIWNVKFVFAANSSNTLSFSSASFKVQVVGFANVESSWNSNAFLKVEVPCIALSRPVSICKRKNFGVVIPSCSPKSIKS